MMSNTNATTARRTCEKTRTEPPRLSRLAHRVVRAYREQLAREDEALLITRFAALDRSIGQTQSRIPDRADPLEQLWRLPARPPRAF